MQFYNKHRPKTFDGFIGNKQTVMSLKSLLSRKENRPQLYLFHGPKGTGKTTLARICCEFLGCNPSDATEINYSDKRGIDSARQLIEDVHILPRLGDVSVWILEEAHQMTKDAANSLLTTFEKPPNHVYIFLCTTEPQMIIPTIQDRCYSYQLEVLEDNDLFKLLSEIVKSEDKKIPNTILKNIVESCEGSTRTALVLLDKVISVPEKDINKLKEVIESEQSELKQLWQALLGNKKWKQVSVILKSLNTSPETVRINTLNYMNAVLLNSGNPNAAIIIEEFEEPFYHSGKAGLTLACFKCINS